MSLSFLPFISLILLSAYFYRSTEARCRRQSREEIEKIESTCAYGTYSDHCSNIRCFKGPGGVCGSGMFSYAGRCVAGTLCNCGRCIGCNSDGSPMECYDKTCL